MLYASGTLNYTPGLIREAGRRIERIPPSYSASGLQTYFNQLPLAPNAPLAEQPAPNFISSVTIESVIETGYVVSVNGADNVDPWTFTATVQTTWSLGANTIAGELPLSPNGGGWYTMMVTAFGLQINPGG